MTILEAMQAWFTTKCQSGWEKQHSIKIETIDNPGWHVTIDLHDPLDSGLMLDVEENQSLHNWFFCTLKNEQFYAAGGNYKLEKIFLVFLQLMTKGKTQAQDESYLKVENGIDRLEEWYFSQCDSDWEHSYGIDMGTLDYPGWYLTIEMNETELEDKSFQELKYKNSPNDWLHCFVKDAKFQGICGVQNLSEMIWVFCEWAKEFKIAK